MQPMPNAEEIRELVERIVDGLGPHGSADGIAAGDAAEESGAEHTTDHHAPAAPSSETVSPGAPGGRIAVGADHGGYALKERIAFKLKEAGYEVHDCGTQSMEPVDYPDLAHAVAGEVASGSSIYGIIVDGAGIGSAIVANKVPGVRAALCYDLSSARNSREHNHANVLTLGAGLIGEALAWQIVQEWLGTDWGPGRHARRVEKITDVERAYARPQ
ncbi:MAG TPA: ribose 5-phosphate isomerase B [Acidimicrobiia bacterium]